MFGSLSFTGLPQASAISNAIGDKAVPYELLKNAPMDVMPFFKVANGLLNPEVEQPQQQPMAMLPTKQGGDYMQNYQNYLKQFGLLGGY